MFWKIYRFEVAYWVKQPMVYVFTLLMGLLVFGAVASDNVTIGQSFDNLHKNAPYVVEILYAYMSAISLLLVTAFVQSAALRDFHHQTEQIIFTTPLKKTSYLLGRFFGACTVSLIPYSGIFLGIILGGMAPWLDPVRVGPIYWGAHLQGMLAFGIPNTLLVGAITFAIAAVTRKTAPTFVAAILLLTAYSVAGTMLQDLDSEALGMLVDAFGIGTFENLTKYWTVADRNTRYLALTGDLLANRLIWLTFAGLILAAGVRVFRFTVDTGRAGKKKAQAAPADPDIQPHLEIHAPLPAVELSFSGRTHVRQVLSQAWVDFVGIVKSTPFMVMMLLALVGVGFSLWDLSEFYGLQTYPVTYRVFSVIQGTTYLYTVLILVFYSGDLVWKERSSRMDEIYDAMPHPMWVTVASKFLAMIGVLFVIQVLMIGLGVFFQALDGYYNFEVGVYAAELLVIDLLFFTYMAVMSFLIHALVNNRYLGYFLFVGFLVLNLFIWAPLEIQTLLVRYGSVQSHVYSDMNGYGPFKPGLFWFNLYWALFALVLLVGTALVWVRGRDTAPAMRARNAGLRFSGSTRMVMGAFALIWVGVGTWIFYNTLVLNSYDSTKDGERTAVEYENRYKAEYEGMLQPRVVDLRYEIDVFPEERDLLVRGEAMTVNKGDRAIDTLFVNVNSDMAMTVEFPGATLAREDEELDVRFYVLSPALQPGDSLPMSFAARYVTEGFENQVAVRQVVPNGTFFNNGMVSPSLGYQSGRELQDRNERRKREMPERARMQPLQRDCTDACMDHYISNFSDWVTMETVISTSPDQIAVAPGSLVEEWTEGDRRYFHYVLDHPSLAFNSFISADYEVLREKWGDVDVEVYYHADHTYNVDKMANSIRKSLTYFQENFGPYRHKQARIIEFPRYASFAQAFPGTMPYSEGIGFIARIEDEDDIDMVFYVTAHEMAHQWWAHQVMGADMEGATVLSETLAQYSAIMVMEEEYGQDQIHKFLKYEMDSYLSARGTEQLQEKPLMRVDANQGYVHYRKGSVVLYYLREMIGEDRVNAALRDLVDNYAYAQPPYPTSHALVDRLREQTPDSLQYLITDLFEEITLFDNRVLDGPSYEELEDGRYRVRFDVLAGKIRADSLGAETPVPMDDYVDLAVFGRPEEGRERGPVLATERRRLTDGEHSFEFVVEELPWEVGVDPNYYLIDRIPDDNVKRARPE